MDEHEPPPFGASREAIDAAPPASNPGLRGRALSIWIVAGLFGLAAGAGALYALKNGDAPPVAQTKKKKKKKKKKKREEREDRERENEKSRVPTEIAPAPPRPVAPKGDTCAEQTTPHPALVDPSKAPTGTAPAKYRVRIDTTAGTFTLKCQRDLAPHGADRFYHLLRIRYYDGVPLFRVIKGFVTQWGIHAHPAVNKAWRSANIEPDLVRGSNLRGTLSFAQAGAPAKSGFTSRVRSTQLFINHTDNSRLDGMGFAPLCEVEGSGMDVVEKIYNGYGSKAGVDQQRLQLEGAALVAREYPKLDHIERACIIETALP